MRRNGRWSSNFLAEVTIDVYSTLVVANNSYLTDSIGCNEWQYTNQLAHIDLIGP